LSWTSNISSSFVAWHCIINKNSSSIFLKMQHFGDRSNT
jgi:hypothetical protein